MKLFPVLFAITFFPVCSFAEDLDNQINKACLRHAVSLITKLEADVIGNLSQEKSNQALQLATNSCQAYFKKEFNQNSELVAEAASNNTEKKDDDESDWFTDKILSGDSSNKEGNKRLKRKN